MYKSLTHSVDGETEKSKNKERKKEERYRKIINEIWFPMTNVEKWRKSKTKKKQFFSMKRFFVACDREHSKKMFVKGTKIDSPLMSIPHISVSRLVCLRTLFAILVGRQTLNLSLPSRQHSNSVRTSWYWCFQHEIGSNLVFQYKCVCIYFYITMPFFDVFVHNKSVHHS